MSKQSTFDRISEEQLVENLESIVSTGKLKMKNEKNKKSVYIASPWFDTKSSVFLTAVKEICQDYENDYRFFFPRDVQASTPMNTYLQNCEQLNNADMVIALIPRKDVGTAFEIGFAVAEDKELVLLAYDESDFNNGTNIMLACSTFRLISITQLRQFLEHKLSGRDMIRIDVNSWEGKE